MSNKILVATDLHNTLVKSNDAWAAAYSKLSGTDENAVLDRLLTKESRRMIAEDLGVSYDDVYNEYRKLLKPNDRMIEFLRYFNYIGIPIVIISSASKFRVDNDLELIKNSLQIDSAYSKETFSKTEKKDWDRLITQYNCDHVLYFGNDKDEDNIIHDKVVSIII